MPTNETIKRIEAIIEADREEMVNAISALVRIPSKTAPAQPGMPFGPACAKALDTALEQAQALGFATENKENMLGWAEFGQGEELLAILAHLDVVPEGDGWTEDPFGGVVKDGFIYGRGTQDDKGPAIAALFAMNALAKAGVPLNKRIRLILGCDEESGSSDIEYYVNNCEIPGMCFSPDAEYPLVNGEKGLLRIGISGAYAVLDKLPRVLRAMGGERANIVTPKASAVVAGVECAEIEGICRNVETRLGVSIACADSVEEGVPAVHVEITGKGAHAAMPEQGNSANTALFELLSLLPLGNPEEKALLFELSALLPHGDNRGHAAKIARRDEISGELTCNPGIFKLEAGKLDVLLDIRYPIDANSASVLSDLRTALNGLNAEIRTDSPPHYVSPDSELVQKLLAAYTDVTGNEGYCMSIGGGTYARGFAGGVSFGCMFPGGDDRMHQADERLSIEELLLNARIMARALYYLACGE